MTLPIQLISTDFDGTLFAEFENPPVPEELQRLIGNLQAQGARWVINTGRDMSSLMEVLGRAHLTIRPDFLVLVEREIYRHEASQYVSVEDWNHRCHQAHAELFARVRPELPRLVEWINRALRGHGVRGRLFALLPDRGQQPRRRRNPRIPGRLLSWHPGLTVMRNDVYARFSHVGFSKGTALAEIGRRLGIGPDKTLAAGDHLNDLPMLSREHARFLVAPANAVESVKASVLEQGGFLSEFPCGYGWRRDPAMPACRRVSEGPAHAAGRSEGTGRQFRDLAPPCESPQLFTDQNVGKLAKRLTDGSSVLLSIGRSNTGDLAGREMEPVIVRRTVQRLELHE